MFDWLGDIFSGIGNLLGDALASLGESISNSIFDAILRWWYEMIYNAVADFFSQMSGMGAEIFELAWVQATLRLFTLFGWSLYAVGLVVAAFDLAIEYQNGRANFKLSGINFLKGFFACSLFSVVPVELYKFCISLQNSFARDLTGLVAGGQSLDLAGESTNVLVGTFAVSADVTLGLLNIFCLLAFAYCVVSVFFQNIKRGGILLIQMSVGALYMFSLPRGFSDGFMQWCKQVAAIKERIDEGLNEAYPSEDYIITMIKDLASQLYSEARAEETIAAQILRKRVSGMRRLERFNSECFSELIAFITIDGSGTVVLHTRTKTTVGET